jgi:hypothetical protein
VDFTPGPWVTADAGIARRLNDRGPHDPRLQVREVEMVITELGVERVEFTCGRCWTEWSIDFDVQHYQNDDGDWEYFSCDGVAAQSPYTPAGARPCPNCGHRWVGRVIARRSVPVPPGPAESPRQRIDDMGGHRPERHGAPLLGARSHTQPGQPGPSVQPGPPGTGSDPAGVVRARS